MAHIRRHRQREPELGYAADALTRAADTGVRRTVVRGGSMKSTSDISLSVRYEVDRVIRQ